VANSGGIIIRNVCSSAHSGCLLCRAECSALSGSRLFLSNAPYRSYSVCSNICSKPHLSDCSEQMSPPDCISLCISTLLKLKLMLSHYTPWKRMRGEIQLLLIHDLGTRWGWVVSVTPLPRFTPGQRTPGTHCTGGWVGPRAGLDTEVTRKILCSCRVSNLDRPVVQSVVGHYTDWATRLTLQLCTELNSQSVALGPYAASPNKTNISWSTVCPHLRYSASSTVPLTKHSMFNNTPFGEKKL
jgi:hypothetical protein